jgi:hypothetical protein
LQTRFDDIERVQRNRGHESRRRSRDGFFVHRRHRIITSRHAVSYLAVFFFFVVGASEKTDKKKNPKGERARSENVFFLYRVAKNFCVFVLRLSHITTREREREREKIDKREREKRERREKTTDTHPHAQTEDTDGRPQTEAKKKQKKRNKTKGGKFFQTPPFYLRKW